MLNIALLALLGGCGKRDRLPFPPSSPSRPLTSVHRHIDSAILVLRRLPGPPRRGPM